MKRYKVSCLIVIAAVAVSGCVTSSSIPMNAGEFRSVIKRDSKYVGKESYEVPVSMDRVVANLSKLAPKCFNTTVKTTASNAFGRVGKSYFHYKATVIPGKAKAEVHVQRYNEGDEVFLKMPKDGIYTVVADASKLSHNKTRVDVYYDKTFGTPVAEAIKGWAHNKKLKCPVLEM